MKLDKSAITSSAIAQAITLPLILVAWELFVRGWVL